MLNEHGVDFEVKCALVAAERGNASVLRAIMQTIARSDAVGGPK